MKPRKLAGGIALAVLALLSFVFDLEFESIGVKIAYTLAILLAMFATFYDKENYEELEVGFSPKRGAMYFLLGFFAFPVSLGVKAAFGADFSIQSAIIFTAFASVLIGAIGTFTDIPGI
ncbi:hypothetical protein [Erythrobacter sp. Alg231-14]|uniref:hypothetical protein n=1 Tax=Erythrobacter sp. Alg231-14 TaxID=1922225 RepID=UPI000D55D278